ncbi:MAG: cytochrome [Rhodospirillales bacterium]|nr:cytochrome [Rhodospirillales bacterium]
MSTPAYDPFMAAVVEGDPNALYAELRSSTPRLFIERYNAWFFSTFEDVWNLEKERTLSVANGITPTQLLLGAPPNPFMVSQMEPPIHTPFRAALNTLVRPSVAQKMEEAMRAEARALLAPIVDRGGGDLLMDYAGPLASRVGCWLSGLPLADSPYLMRTINQFFHRDPAKPGDTGVGGQAGVELIGYITNFLAQVRAGRHPATGSLGVLLDEQRTDPSITDDHIVFIVMNVQIAASDTVPKGIAATFHRLWSNPGEREKLRAMPHWTLSSFLEAVRIDMPTQMQGRTVTERLEFGDIVLEPGQKTMFMFASANRDEAEFDAPDLYRIDRGNRRTLGFGNGLHRCLGVHVAQVEGKVAIEEAMALLPGYTVDLAASRKHKTEYVKGWSNLVVTIQ